MLNVLFPVAANTFSTVFVNTSHEILKDSCCRMSIFAAYGRGITGR